jgi:hypothetical protein
MKRTINSGQLTKNFIESKISPELIVSKYLGLDIEVVKECIKFNSLIESPFRDDDPNPSCGIQYNNKGKLKIRDFGGFFWGDVYDLVAYVLTIGYGREFNVSNKQDFYNILKHISYTFKDIVYGKEIDPNHDYFISSSIKKMRGQKSIIELVSRSWNKEDVKIWNKWGITTTYLDTHFVYPVEQYYINRFSNPQPKYFYNYKDPCYAYVLGINRKGIYNIKLYFPNRDRTISNKFITNSNCLEGIPNLELYNYDYIIITKSSKDRLSLGCHLYEYPLRGDDNELINVGIINVPSENYKLNQQEYDFLHSRLKSGGTIISFMDFDRQGRECSAYLRDTYNIPYIFITRGEFGVLNDYGAKDFAELKENYSYEVINEFILETYKLFTYGN